MNEAQFYAHRVQELDRLYLNAIEASDRYWESFGKMDRQEEEKLKRQARYRWRKYRELVDAYPGKVVRK